MDTLDRMDRRLLAALQEDSSRTTAELADLVGLSQAPCWRRLQKLRQSKLIRKEVALLDGPRLGWNAEFFVHVKLSAHGRGNVAEFTRSIEAHPQVTACFILLGSVDALLRVVARDIRDYEVFFYDHLSRTPGVQEANTMTVLSVIKDTTSFPIDGLRPAQPQ